MRNAFWTVPLLVVCVSSPAWSQGKERPRPSSTSQQSKPTWQSQVKTLSWQKFIAQVPEAEVDAARKAWSEREAERKREIHAATLAELETKLSSAELTTAAYERMLVKMGCESFRNFPPVEKNIHRVLTFIGKVANSGLPSFFSDRMGDIDPTREALAAMELPKLREDYEKALAALPPKPRMEALREVFEGKTDAAQRTLAEWKKLSPEISGAWEPAQKGAGDYLRAHLNDVQLPPLPERNATQACYRSAL